MIDEKLKEKLLISQKNEITEHFIYARLFASTKDAHNKEILKNISEEELKHYNVWKKYTNEDKKPDKLKIWFFFIISKVLGLTFGIKLMEKGEERAQISYEEIAKVIPEADNIRHEEEKHENDLVGLIDEERLKYVGSMVLGLNDALVELTGALAGFTLALQNVRLIAVTGLITGIAASMSMAASEYLSTKSERSNKVPFKASLYTGFAYVLAVFLLVFPYFVFDNLYLCLGFTVFNAVFLIFIFTFYISVAMDMSFKKRFFEMAPLTLGISALTFFIGFLVRVFLKIEV